MMTHRHFITSIKHPATCVDLRTVSLLLNQGLRQLVRWTSTRDVVHVVANQVFDDWIQHDRIRYHACNLSAPVSSPSDLIQNTEAIRFDRGTKYLSVLRSLSADERTSVMFFDYDDLIGRGFLSNPVDPTSNHVIRSGFVLNVTNSVLVRIDNGFQNACGTSHVLRWKFLERLLNIGDETQIIQWFGSHRFYGDLLVEHNEPTEFVDAPSVVYRVGHGENWTGDSETVLSMGVPVNHPLQFAEEYGLEL